MNRAFAFRATFVGVGIATAIWLISRLPDNPPAPSPASHEPPLTAAIADSSSPGNETIPTLELPAGPQAQLNAEEARLADSIVKTFQAGDYAKALAAAEQAYAADTASAGFHNWLATQLPTLLTSVGWKSLHGNDCDTAIEFLRRAASLQRSKDTAKGLAYCYSRVGIHALAIDEFAFYLEASPGDPDMLMLYSDSLESEGRLQESAEALASLLQLPEDQLKGHENLGDRESLTKRLAGMREKARESPRQSREASTNFLIAYRFDRHDAVIPVVIKTLEDALDEYVDDLGFRPPAAPIEVVLYQADYFRRVVPGGPTWAEGIFDGRLRIPVGDEKNGLRDPALLRRVLRHELVHALTSLLTDKRPLPSWFAEGLAQRLECRENGTDSCPTFEFTPTPGAFLAASTLESPFTALDSVVAGRAYSQSLYLVHVVERTLGGADALRDIVRAITPTANITSNDLLVPLGIGFDSLHRRASAYWAQRTPPERMSGSE